MLVDGCCGLCDAACVGLVVEFSVLICVCCVLCVGSWCCLFVVCCVLVVVVLDGVAC